jgi:hypothetical protein
MKRALALLLTVTAIAAGCGGSSSGSGSGGSSGSSSSGSLSATDLLKQSQAATKNATSAAFDMTMNLQLAGNLKGAGSAAAFLQGPLSLEIRGEAGHVTGGAGKFDLNFALNFSGGSFSGRAVSADGKTAYIQMPTLLGPGWKSVDLSSATSSATGSSSSSTQQSLAQLKALGLDPAKWLTNINVTSTNGSDKIDADLDLKAIIADVARMSKSPIPAKDQAKLDQFVNAVKTSHVSESFDSATHLPTDASLEFAVTVPPSLRKQASGLTGLDFKLDIAFSKWNEDFTVKAPSGATPLGTGGLLGLGGAAPAA